MLAGTGSLSSLEDLPPGGIVVSDPDTGGRLTVVLTAGDAAAVLSAAASGGATVSGSGAALSLSGTAAQVNAALASLEISEPAGTTRDSLSLSATDPGAVGAGDAIAVAVVPLTGPAFVAPPLLVTLQPDALDAVGGLLLSDPVASGLAAMGLGQEETLELTLAVADGILVLPGFSLGSAIAAQGLGSGTIVLDFTADQIPAFNTLLAGLEFAGTAGGEELSYVLKNFSGVLPAASTSGNIFLNVAGTAGAARSIAAGVQSVQLGSETLSGTTTIAGTMAVLGNISGTGAVVIQPDAALELPQNALFLGGTSMDFGTLAAGTLVAAGKIFVAGGAGLNGPVLLGTAGLLDVSGLLVADGGAQSLDALAVSLAAGAVLTGNGTLLAGNFSESGMLTGPGTILALGGETLLLAAGTVGGAAKLAVAPGGVMVLGPVDPLYGVFDATPLTIDSSVTLSFGAGAAAQPIGGEYANSLGANGGAFVINGPEVFSGTIVGFAPGDQLIFPGLASFSVYNEMSGSFTVAGQDAAGDTVDYEIYAAIPTGTGLVAAADAAGAAELVVRPTAAIVMAAGGFAAGAGIAQPLLGLDLELLAATTQSLNLTLSVRSGVLSAGSVAASARITLAGNIGAMESALAGLSYTGTGVADAMTITSSSGVLAGMVDYFAISAAAAGTVNGYGTVGISEAQTASFGSAGATMVTVPLAAGALLVDANAVFADQLAVDGILATALLVEDGATAMFDPAADAAFGANILCGDANGAGTLVVEGAAFAATGNLTLGVAGSQADLLGTVTLGGTAALVAGTQLDLGGSLVAGAVTLASGASILAYGSAALSAGPLLGAGSLALDDAAVADVSAVQTVGSLSLGGTAMLDVAGTLALGGGGSLQIGGDATVRFGVLAAVGTVTDAGLLSGGMVTDAGTMVLAGGSLVATSLAVTGVLAGFGDVDAASLTGPGSIYAQGGRLVLGGASNDAGPVAIGAAAALEIAGGFAGGTISFAGGAALLSLDEPGSFAAGVQNFVATDAIDLVGTAPGSVKITGGTVTVQNGAGSAVASFGLQVAGGQPAVAVIGDGAGGALITLGDELPCFARGTRLLTPTGYRAVESLRPGDPVMTAAGARRPVRWVGRRVLDLGPGAARFAWPVVISPGAFGPDQPLRPLRLSPLHCVYVDKILIPATHLVNGATIRRERAAAMTYFHIELDRHDSLVAEGLACESYFDSGNRGGLYQEMGRRSPAARMFAPCVTTGARLAAVRRRLHERACDAGFVAQYWPVLRAIGGGESVIPRMAGGTDGRKMVLDFADAVAEITLLAQVACPADTDPGSEDRRELGICLAPIGENLRFGTGWYARAATDAGVWMGRVATLQLARPAQTMAIGIAAVVQSWAGGGVDGGAGGG